MVDERKRAYNRAYYLANPDKYNKRTREQRDKYNAARRDKYHSDPVYRAEMIRAASRSRTRHPDARACSTYKLDRYELELMTDAGCAICHVSFSHEGVRRHIDHDHATGKVRGVLCQPCNLALGHIADDPIIAASILRYLLNGGSICDE